MDGEERKSEGITIGSRYFSLNVGLLGRANCLLHSGLNRELLRSNLRRLLHRVLSDLVEGDGKGSLRFALRIFRPKGEKLSNFNLFFFFFFWF